MTGPNASQIVLGAHVLEAFRQVGILPAECYTVTEHPATIEVARDKILGLNVTIAIPLDKLIEALQLVPELMGLKAAPVDRSKYPHCDAHEVSEVFCEDCKDARMGIEAP